jgi:drug/metabolite transporter (DMT)-like permease
VTSPGPVIAGRPVTASRATIAVALATVYVVWGSTYLAIRWTVHDLPVFASGAIRFLIAGGGFLLAVRLRGPLVFTRKQVLSAALLGALMPGLSNGLVALAERRVPSSLTALILSTLPLWIALFQLTAGERPAPRAALGLLVGFAGTGLLVAGGTRDLAAPLGGVALIVIASLLWATGSLLARRFDRPRPWMASSGIEMISGGLVQAILATATGDLPRLVHAHPGPRAVLSLIYLTVVGAWAGYGAFSWLTANVAPTLVATYSYVNPLVAVLLGFALAGEPLTARTAIAGAIIVSSVVLVTTARRRA